MLSLTSFQRSVMDIYERPLFRARVTPKFPAGKIILAKRGVVMQRAEPGPVSAPPWPLGPLA